MFKLVKRILKKISSINIIEIFCPSMYTKELTQEEYDRLLKKIDEY